MSSEALTPSRVRLARWIAVGVDFLQIIVFPAFAPGIASPWDAALALATAFAMYARVGWHWAFLPSCAAELVPGLDLVPTWTAAVFFATRGKSSAPPVPAAPPPIDTEVVSSSKPKTS